MSQLARAMKMPDRDFMQAAIEEAAKCQPEDSRIHPKVGVVVVKDGHVLAKAFRGEIDRGAHAEYTAIEKKLRTDQLSGATIYTTLEPCVSRNHPKVPCAFRLIERRVARVVVGMLDPNQEICGRGIRSLRDGSIVTDLFPDDLMSVVEEQNRDFIREHQRLSRLQAQVCDMVSAAGISAFFASREHYREYRSEQASIDKYIDSAKQSVMLVSVNLMTGVKFDGLCHLLKRKLETKNSRFSATISLLNPTRKELMSAMAPVLDLNANALARGIRDTVADLVHFRNGLSAGARTRVKLLAHNSIPFGSAILLDHRSDDGRIQIETKPYKAPIRDSFAFEVMRRHKGRGLYEPLMKGYETLVKDADEL